MYEYHDVFDPPINLDESIWRYMDLTKFISMLQANALHFARADIMEDVFEGSTSQATVEQRRRVMMGVGVPSDNVERLNEQMSGEHRKFRRYTYLNCWHRSENESVAMWKIYQSGEPQEIAIRSTYRRLIDSITDPRTVYVGTVSYINYETELMPERNMYFPFVHKRLPFDYEREIRAVHPGTRIVPDATKPDTYDDAPVGDPVIAFETDLDILVEAVYVSPKAHPWFVDVVRNVMESFGKTWPVQYSSIDGKPVF